MTRLAIDVSSVIITFSLCLYFSVITFQLVVMLVESVTTRRMPSRFWSVGLCQNAGVACVILGYTFQTTGLALVGVLLIATALLASAGRIPTLVPAVEVPLSVLGILSLVSLGVIYTIA